MKRYSLRTSMSIRFALLVLVVVSLVSLISSVLISRQFENYVIEQQKSEADNIAENIASQYGAEEGGWNIDYIHGMGMYALNEGFIIKLYDKDENVLWDAENHDMSLCHEVMNTITVRMQEKRPELQGDFVSHRYDLKRQGNIVGYLEVSYYTPYYMNENDFQFVTALNRILIVIGGASLIAAVLLGILLANSITNPLSRVIGMTKLISDGDYAERLDTDGKTKEIYELTASVNRMAASLYEQDALRKQLTSDVAHELRTPIANISSYMEMMLDDVMEPTPERLKSCYDELQRLSGLISDLERLRQEEVPDMTLEKVDVELRKLSETVLHNFETLLKEKHIEAQVTGSESVIKADRDRIQQVLTNLVSNAVKYSDDGGSICIDISDDGDSSVISVSDNGIGIAEEDLKRIFERFYRTDKSRNRKTGGAGIGLTIAKAIVQAHKGTITVESETGKGSKFIVTLPKRNI